MNCQKTSEELPQKDIQDYALWRSGKWHCIACSYIDDRFGMLNHLSLCHRGEASIKPNTVEEGPHCSEEKKIFESEAAVSKFQEATAATKENTTNANMKNIIYSQIVSQKHSHFHNGNYNIDRIRRQHPSEVLDM